jgi:Zn-dependent protease with chaperone function/predicted nucleic-acid-binding protein
MNQNLYPESPRTVPVGLTQVSGAYKRQVLYVMAAIVLFLCLYAAMIAGAGFLVYGAFIYPMGSINKFTILLKLGSIAASVMLLAFLLKFLLTRHNTDNNPLYLEITEQEHPRLFAFIRQLCQETQAPFPNRIFVSHEINAAVFYNSTLLSLFLPVKKNLLIGLGFVNSVNLSEFKAVLAHEFGHFSQKSMKLGSHIYIANRIIYEMVYGRNQWDDWFEKWKASDIRLSFFAWLLMPIVWTIRKGMSLIYQVINLIHASLSRQMEFNADLVAVSVTGSNAIVNALYKLGISGEAFSFSNGQVSTAIDNKLYTRNLFYHHTRGMEHLKRHDKQFSQSLLAPASTANGGKHFLFNNEDEHLPEMYASHPSNYKREQNAKATFVEGVEDNQSPWLLFEEAEAMAEKVTRNMLTVNLELPDNAQLIDPEEVQQFIEAELRETTYDARYHGVYDNRFLTELPLGDTEAIIAAAGITADGVGAALDQLFGAELHQQMESVNWRRKDMEKVALVLQKYDKRKEFTLSDGTYPAKEAKQVHERIVQSFEADQEWYRQFDQKVFTVHYQMLSKLPEMGAEFMHRYTFHLELQTVLKGVRQVQEDVQTTVNALIAAGQITQKQGAGFAAELYQARTRMEAILTRADQLVLPAFNNTATIQAFGKYLLEEPLVEVYHESVDGGQINGLMNQAGTVLERSRRMYFKSLGGILNLQQQMVTQYLAQKQDVIA